MFCYQCGKQIVDGARYCHYCGSEQPDFVQEGADLPRMNPAPVQSQVGPAPAPEPEPLGYQGQMIYAPAEPQPAKKKGGFVTGLVEKYGKKKLAIIGGSVAGALVLVVGIVVAAVLLSGGGGKIKSRSKTGFMFQTDYKVTGASFDYLIAEENVSDSDAHYGVLDYDGNQVLPFAYDEMKFVDNDLYPDLFMVKKNGLCGLIKADGTEEIRVKYDAVGYCERYDTLYAIDDDVRKITLFDVKGNQTGQVSYNSRNSLFDLDSHFPLITGNNISNLERWDESEDSVAVYGLTASHTFCLCDGKYIKFIDISSGEVLNQYDRGDLGRSVVSLDKDSCYYIISRGTYRIISDEEIPQGQLPSRTEFMVDSNGNKIDKVIIKNSKGKKLAQFGITGFSDCKPSDDYKISSVRVINDSGLCLVHYSKSYYGYTYGNPYSVSLQFDGYDELENIKTGKKYGQGQSYSFWDNKEKIELTNPSSDDPDDPEHLYDDITIFNQNGEKLYERSHLSNNIILYDHGGYVLKEVLKEGALFLFSKPHLEDRKVIYQPFIGEEKEIIGPRNVHYTYMQRVSDGYYLLFGLDEEGKVISAILDNERMQILDEFVSGLLTTGLATMHGICVQTDDGKVWWYNRKA